MGIENFKEILANPRDIHVGAGRNNRQRGSAAIVNQGTELSSYSNINASVLIVLFHLSLFLSFEDGLIHEEKTRRVSGYGRS